MESIQEIAKDIKRIREGEIRNHSANLAVSRSSIVLEGKNITAWLVNRENNQVPSYYTRDDRPIYKNLRIAEYLIKYAEGTYSYKGPNENQIDFTIFNKTSYKPSVDNSILASDLLVQFEQNPKVYSFRSLLDILALQQAKEETQKKLEQSVDDEAKELLSQIKAIEEKQKSIYEHAQHFIRKNAELRYQPILDPKQESIKRSNIFENILIINGGPGTGKTTSLIQRIKFLISESINEYRPLTLKERQIITDQNWVFFAPNELLKLFLQNSMIEEGLPASNERVKVWDNHKKEIVKAYGLVTMTRKPFLYYSHPVYTPLFNNDYKSIKLIESLYFKFLIQNQREKLEKIIDLDLSGFSWRKTGISIQEYLLNNIDSESINDFLKLYINLSEIYTKESNAIKNEFDSLLERVCTKITVRVRNDQERKTKIQDLLDNWGKQTAEAEQEDDEEEGEEQIEISDQIDSRDLVFARTLIGKLKGVCSKAGLKLFEKNIRFTRPEEDLIKMIPEISPEYQFVSVDDYKTIGSAAFYRKYFLNFTRGVEINLLKEIPGTFKKFRKVESKKDNTLYCNTDLLEELVTKDGNSRIHPDEQAFLLVIINQILKSIQKSYSGQFDKMQHQYVEAFKHFIKPIIGIDEASDFSLIDHMAMQSLSHPVISSVTLAGDLMQRMTRTGVNSWQELVGLWPNTTIKDLEVSYRQSPTLLKLASAIYRQSTGIAPAYRPFIEHDSNEPTPLLFMNDDEEQKLLWIAERLMEIYKAYGNSIPSIAIFVSHEDEINKFAKNLSQNDDLLSVGISIKPCSGGEVLGDKNTVRVFSVDVIKGLEFEAVFFHNVDDLFHEHLENDLLLKYMYVGLSRATFYFGMTSKEQLPENVAFLIPFFDPAGTW